MNFPIPEVRQRVTPRDAVFYALSVGLGQDPLDRRQLDYVDHHRALKALPSMAVVLGHPGFWLRDPRTGVDAVRLVHGEQGIRLLKPLPVDGEIIGRTRVIGLVDKGAGKGALLYSEKQVIDAATGDLLAVTESTTFLRGDGGFGGPAGPIKPPHPIPEGAPDWTIDLATRPEQALYYRLNGDDNPLHADPGTAEKAGFPRPILHGLCTLGVAAHALLRALGDYDAARCRSLALRFTAPVFPGETIRTEIWRDGAFRARVVERDQIVVNNGRAEFEGVRP
ncbi:MaoC family protein [Aliidongia dinghuensis]|uniref:MaoC family protein n=2 Tax=Aliidongia dinghuensis TaxID=1867774 RepID=A0A8J2YSP7_9PROT|nr:MaoC family protein [Aliidongia dinghuensis]